MNLSGINHCKRKYVGLLAQTLGSLCLIIWGALLASGFNPPVDEAGPLRVRIDGPTEIAARQVPVEYTLVIENRGEVPVQGTFTLKVIDDWQIKPADNDKFAVSQGQSFVHRFYVIPGAETYPAHYPIHAYVRFEQEGWQFEAHPILILQAKVPPRYPDPVAPAWRPFPLARNIQVRLWEIPVFRVVTQVFGREPEVHPVGWQGTVEEHRANAQVVPVNVGGTTREAISMHPPWFEGKVGTTWWEIPVKLPTSAKVAIQFFAAINPTGQSDGVTFRIRAVPWDAPLGQAGEIVFESHIVDKTWRPLSVDLTKFAGQEVRLQLEADPGPKRNTGWDQSFWGEPMLVVGEPKAPSPALDPATAIRLGVAQWENQRWEYLLWPGERGWLDATVSLRSSTGKEISFRGFQLRVLGVRVDSAHSPFLLTEIKDELASGERRARHILETPWGPIELVVAAETTDGILRFRFWLEKTPPPRPFWAVFIEDLAVDKWSEAIWRVYAGHGNVIQQPGEFSLGFDGHRLASSFIGIEFGDGKCLVQAVDNPPTHLRVDPARQHASLHVPHSSTMMFIPHENIWKAVKIYREGCGLRAAAGVPLAAGRFVFDLWGGRYRESAAALENAFRYGLTDAMVLWHNWQRWGYDYRLPEIFPPNPQLGSLEDMRLLVDTCRKHGVLFGLHDNYIDFYPDAEGFSYKERIAFTKAGQPVRAWFNEGRNAQSYRFRADQVEPFLRQNLRLIKEHLAPTAYFIDVWASIEPYDYWTADGQFVDRVYTRNSWREHFAWIREFLGGSAPQISESGHDQLIGWLDGATANHLRVGSPVGAGRYQWAVWNWPCQDAERIPWLDAAHHHRFILHGAGYAPRYQAGLDPRLHGIYSDDYITTEMLTGHPAMVSAPFGYDVVRKYWLTQPVARALALRTIEDVTFVDNDLHRQIVSWSDGGKVWVNRGQTDWVVEGVVLPPYGFLARVNTSAEPVEASIARRSGVISEMAVCPHWLYVNGRKFPGEARSVHLRVESVRIAAPNTLELSLRWTLKSSIPEGYRPFLHFCDQDGEIAFQASVQGDLVGPHREGELIGVARTYLPNWQAGNFELRAGWFHPGTGRRLPLQGPDDGTSRVRIGKLQVATEAGKLTDASFAPILPEQDPVLSRQNPEGRLVDFGPVMTAGGCRLQPQEGRLVVTPLPGQTGEPWEIRIRWSALPWRLAEPRFVRPISIEGSPGEKTAIKVTDGIVTLFCEPGVFAYELSAE
ncbi:MAG: hypothetical protein NZ899_06595 [Thermoguttaceae bacterium]|nr:hypothetical protein [Thermoguttaceae bacterium]MDW8078563.1 hypothetical protein [Thermoguttaceae bacterium]